MKVLIKRSIEKDGLPKETRRYLVEYQSGDQEVRFYEPDYWDGVEQEIPKFWYEEIELSTLLQEVMPTEEEIEKEFPDEFNNGEIYIANVNIKAGISWLKSKLTTITP